MVPTNEERHSPPATFVVPSERAQEQSQQLQDDLVKHVESYPIQLDFPVNVFSSTFTSKDNVGLSDESSSSYLTSTIVPRTSSDFINYRILESGLKFAVFEDQDETSKQNEQTIHDVSTLLTEFINDLNKTGCYDSVQVVLGRPISSPSKASLKSSSSSDHTIEARNSNSDGTLRQIDVILKEKRWYKLYIGGGIKPVAGLSSSIGVPTSDHGFLPRVQFETSAGLLNLTGHCDVTSLGYTVDQTSSPTLSVAHSRPLYSCFGPNNSLQDWVLALNNGSKVTATFRAEMDTVDYESTRSSKDHQQLIGVRISNQHTHHHPSLDGAYKYIDWTFASRHVIPKRHPTLPYLCDASPEIVAMSGSSLKHSISTEFRMNGSAIDHKFNPTSGWDTLFGGELAGPPGDVGFLKLWYSGSCHFPLFTNDGLAFHASLRTGFLRPLSYGGLCSTSGMTNIVDRFYIGGPHQLRGFLPGGIGPRSKMGGACTPGGDSLGGDIFYTALGAMSLPFPGIPSTRLFLFANIGTLSGYNSALTSSAFLRSSRIALGAGLSTGLPMGRLEITYSFPLRFGPMDARRSLQFGLGLNFG